MDSSRRTFLGAAAYLSASAAIGMARQRPEPKPHFQSQAPPQSEAPDASTSSSDPMSASPDSPWVKASSPREILRQNQEAIKKDMTRLTKLVGELQDEFENHDIKDVLSLSVVHDTEEIEKLAKHIRSLVRG